jgi:MarR family transcriptional regulator, negative regulator of the multidrug operon emrRAB
MSASRRTANLLGAAALAITDELTRTLPLERDAAALVLIRQLPGDGVDALARRLGLTHSGAVRLVDRLARDGLVTRGGASDRRRVALALTPAGERRTDEILGERAAVLEGLLGAVPAGERAAFTRTLETLLAALTPDAEHGERICRLCDLDVCPLDSCPVELAA